MPSAARRFSFPLLAALAVAATPSPGRAGDASEPNEVVVAKGLNWLKEHQHKDGSWSDAGQYPTAVTALAGMALMMEGSSLREGKYSDEIAKAVDWTLRQQQGRGLYGNPANPMESGRYMLGHGYALLFLASAYGEHEDANRHRALRRSIESAVAFTVKAQTTTGGWGYTSARDGGNFDECYVAVMQLQGLQACRKAGIAVPKGTFAKAMKYYEKLTTDRGGLVYGTTATKPAVGAEGVAITATALAAAACLGQMPAEHPRRWATFSRDTLPRWSGSGHDEFHHYYLAQAAYALGETGFAEMHPNDPGKPLKWSTFKAPTYEFLHRSQTPNGFWHGGYAGPTLATAFALSTLQLENNVLPIFGR